MAKEKVAKYLAGEVAILNECSPETCGIRMFGEGRR
jgi:hypothetical protein